MRPDSKAVIFDLDDTLYPLREFVRSGFAAVARHLEQGRGVNGDEAFALLTQASAGSARGLELQACAMHFNLPLAIVPELVEVIRWHTPSLTLPTSSRAVLEALRSDWSIGVMTNGRPDIQARKVRALGIEALVDHVIYANELGNRDGKPEPEPFLVAAQRLGVALHRSVFVGDDARCDVFGAGRVGMKTIHVTPRSAAALQSAYVADATVETLDEVPAIARRLVTGVNWSADVA